MKTRFRKVWCSSCSTMQFAGECGHGLVEAPAPRLAFEARIAERHSWDTMVRGVIRLGRALLLPKPSEWTEYKVGGDGSLTNIEPAKGPGFPRL